MQAIQELKALIDEQVASNRRKNILCAPEKSAFGFLPEITTYLRQHHRVLSHLRPEEEDRLLEHLVTAALKAFCQANQYYYFNALDKEALTKQYRKLLDKLKSMPVHADEVAYQQVASTHYRALQSWIKRSNPFVKKLYAETTPYLEQEVVCEEYSAALQLQLLRIDLSLLQEPVLDLGCGQRAFLVKYLRKHKLEAYGVDRNVLASAYTVSEDWFEFDLSAVKWGTIISNVGFSNHFQHHHKRIDGDYAKYTMRYKEILQALVVGGSFLLRSRPSFYRAILRSQ